jgi:competence protein ComEC
VISAGVAARRRRPLVLGSLAFASGAAAGLTVPGMLPALATSGAATAAATVAGLAAWMATRGASATPGAATVPPVTVGLAVWALLLAGLAHGGAAALRLERHPFATLPEGREVEVAGVLEARPGADGVAWLRADSIRLAPGGAWRPLRSRVRLRPATGGGRRPRGGAGPAGRADDRAWLPAALALRVQGVWRSELPRGRVPPRAERRGWVEVREARSDGAKGALRARLRAGAQGRLRAWLGGRAPAAEAMLLARRETLPRAARERFAAAGLSHLLAISGLHVAVVAGGLIAVGSVARLPRRSAVGGAAAGVLAYVALLGFPHAATRAATQICLVLWSRVRQRPADPRALVAAAALVLLLVDPRAAVEPGFQMSFAGVAGLLAWHRPLTAVLRPLPGRALREAAAASVAATAATAPIAAWTFGQAAPIGLAANLVAIPLAGLAVPALATTLAAGILAPPAGALLGGGAAVLLAALELVAGAAAAIPGGHFAVARPRLGALACGALGAWAAHRVLSRRRGPGRIRPAARRLLVAGVACSAAAAGPPLVALATSGVLELHVIDVGQGDAVALRTPRGRWLLVDAGPRSRSFDAGRALVVPYLLRQGTDELEALLLTHPDADHIGGAAAVVEALAPALIIDPAEPTGKAQYLDVLRAVRASGGAWIRGFEGAAATVDGVRVVLLAPDSAALAAPTGANDISLVARVEFGEFRALLMGDAPAEVERRLVANGPDELRADVLKVGHHGSDTSTSTELLAAARPRIALIPVGRRNRYGHPHRSVTDRLRGAGAVVLRTDRDGSIVLRARATGEVAIVGRAGRLRDGAR